MAIHSDHPDFLLDKITVFLSGEHPCSYLPGKFSQEIYAQPLTRFNNHIYSQLIYTGYRRSGELVYRPHCKFCSACIPVRIPARDFKPNRSQRRTIQANANIEVRRCPPEFNEEQFSLYEKYVNSRHPDGGMDNPDPREYREMLTCHWTRTEFIEFRLDDRLLAVAVIDVLDDGFSAVYTFWDTDAEARSLGTWAILWQIDEIIERGLDYLYLGYLIYDCKKMSYKQFFRPFEQFVNNRWERV